MSPLPLCAPSDTLQDRETEPRFTGPPSARGDFGGGGGGGFRGGYGGGGGGYGGGGPPMGGGARQLYVSNVRLPFHLCSNPSLGRDVDVSSFLSTLAGRI
jgi:hypothetical protein